jgi:hypothetical protein
MEFRLTNEQDLLAETVRELVARSPSEEGVAPEAAAGSLWRELVEFGTLEAGALGTVDLALVARALGERLAAVPLSFGVAPRRRAGAGASTLWHSPSTNRRPATIRLALGALDGGRLGIRRRHPPTPCWIAAPWTETASPSPLSRRAGG